MTPRKFYLGFGPPIVKTTRGGVEYGIGSIPLGGYVKIPGMNRPSPGDLRTSLKPEQQQALAEPLDALDAALERGDEDAARAELPALEAAARHEPRCRRSSRWRSRPTRTGGRRPGGASS